MNTNKNKELNELVGGDVFATGGDRNITGNSEIETGPVDKPFNDTSFYEKGIPPTTDKVVNRYRQNIPWFAVYSWGNSRRGMLGTSGAGGIVETNVLKKKTVEEKIEDLVKKSKSNDITDKNYDSKVDKITSSIKDTTLTKAQIEELINTLSDKIEDLDKPKNI
jgi:hypothetical protein